MRDILKKIASIQRRRRASRLAILAAQLLVILVVVGLIVFAVDWFGYLSLTGRMLLVSIAGCLMLVGSGWKCKHWWGERESRRQLILEIENQQGSADLLAAVQFYQQKNPPGSSALRQALLQRVSDSTSQVQLSDPQLARKRSWAVGAIAAVGVLVGIIFIVANGFLSTFANRIIQLSDGHYPSRTIIASIRLNDQIVLDEAQNQYTARTYRAKQNQPVQIVVQCKGLPPEKALLFLTDDSGRRREIALTLGADDTGNGSTYRGHIPQVESDLRYWLKMGDAWTEWSQIKVIPLPIVEIEFDVQIPEYAATVIENFQTRQRDIEFPAGSRLVPRLRCGNDKTLKSVALKLTPLQSSASEHRGARSLALVPQANGKSWGLAPGLELRLIQSHRFEFIVEDQSGFSPERIPAGQLIVSGDGPPEVALAATSSQVTRLAEPILTWTVEDPFAIEHLEWTAIKNGVPIASRRFTPPPSAISYENNYRASGEIKIPLDEFQLAEGDRISVTLRATAERGDLPADSSTSEPVSLEVVSTAKMLEHVLHYDEEIERRLSEIIRLHHEVTLREKTPVVKPSVSPRQTSKLARSKTRDEILDQTRDLRHQFVSLQIKLLTENHLENTPKFSEIQALSEKLIAIESKMNRSLVTEPSRLSAWQHDGSILVQLMQCRNDLARRLQRSRTMEELEILTLLQTENRERSQPATVLEVQKLIVQLITQVRRSIEIATKFENESASRFQNALIVLDDTKLAEIGTAAVQAIEANDRSQLAKRQQQILDAAESLAKTLQGLDQSNIADRNSAIRLLEQLMVRHAQIRIDTLKLLSQKAEVPRKKINQLAKRQHLIHDELMRVARLTQLIGSAEAPLAQSLDHTFEAATFLSQHKLEPAKAQQALLAGLLEITRDRLLQFNHAADEKSPSSSRDTRQLLAHRIGTAARLMECLERLGGRHFTIEELLQRDADRVFDLRSEYRQQQQLVEKTLLEISTLVTKLGLSEPESIAFSIKHVQRSIETLAPPRSLVTGEIGVSAESLTESARNVKWLLSKAANELRTQLKERAKQLSQLCTEQTAALRQTHQQQRASFERCLAALTAEQISASPQPVVRELADILVLRSELERDEAFADEMVLFYLDQAEAKRSMLRSAKQLSQIELSELATPTREHVEFAKELNDGMLRFVDTLIEISRRAVKIRRGAKADEPALQQLLAIVSQVSSLPEKSSAAAARQKASEMGDGLIPQTPRRTAELIAGRAAISRMALIFGDNPQAQSQMSVGAESNQSQAPQQKAAEKPTEAGSKKEVEGEGAGKSRGKGEGKAAGKGEGDGQGKGEGKGAGAGKGNAAGSTENSQDGKASSRSAKGGGAGGGNAADNAADDTASGSGNSQNTAGSKAGERGSDVDRTSFNNAHTKTDFWQERQRQVQAFQQQLRYESLPSAWRERFNKFNKQ